MRGWTLAILAVAAGCGGSPPPRPPSPEAEEAPPLGPLTALVPEDATLVVVARPAALLASPATALVARALFSDEQLDRFRDRNGVDPRELEELVICTHPEGAAAIARGPIDAPFAVREAGDRMAPLEASTGGPRPRRVGFLGPRRTDLSALARDVVLWVEGSPQLAAGMRAAASRGRRAPPERLASALEPLADAPLVLVAPHPLGLPLDTGVGLLLAGEETLAADLRSEGRDLLVEAELRGEFPPDAQDHFRALATSVARSDLGEILGLREALPTLRIQVERGRVALRARVAAATLARGLRALLAAEIRELLADPEGAPDPDR